MDIERRAQNETKGFRDVCHAENPRSLQTGRIKNVDIKKELGIDCSSLAWSCCSHGNSMFPYIALRG